MDPITIYSLVVQHEITLPWFVVVCYADWSRYRCRSNGLNDIISMILLLYRVPGWGTPLYSSRKYNRCSVMVYPRSLLLCFQQYPKAKCNIMSLTPLTKCLAYVLIVRLYQMQYVSARVTYSASKDCFVYGHRYRPRLLTAWPELGSVPCFQFVWWYVSQFF